MSQLLARRKALQVAVSALCVEVGFTGAEKDALGTLTEIVQSYISEVGRSARAYSELASRTEPTLTDVQKALVDGGIGGFGALPDYSKRPQRRHLQRQLKSYPAPTSKSLQVGSKPSRPPYIPPSLPPLPDPHTYIKTPVFTAPVADYRATRARLAAQKRNTRRGLSRILARTRPSRPIAGERDPTDGLYSIVTSTGASAGPAYISALLPTAQNHDNAREGIKKPATKPDPNNISNATANQRPVSVPCVPNTEWNRDKQHQRDRDVGGLLVQTPSSSSSSFSSSNTFGSDVFENPFLRPAKRIKLKLLS